MSSTYIKLNYHVIFATKHRKPTINQSWKTGLFNYLRGTAKGLGAKTTDVGGVCDHIHLLVSLPSTVAIADFIRELKKSSSAWIRQQHCSEFEWQRGYAALSVSPSSIPDVKAYLAKQEEHHKARSSKDELLAILEKSGIPFHPKFLE